MGEHFVTKDLSAKDSIDYLVDSVSTININGKLLKRLKVHCIHHPSNLYAPCKEIIENIGFTCDMFPWSDASCNEFQTGPLGCYSDSILGFYNFGTNFGKKH